MKKAAHVGFLKPMECLPVLKLPEGQAWIYELKLDGHRVEAVRRGDSLSLFSRRESSYTAKFHAVVKTLRGLPDDTVIDGELTASTSSVGPGSAFSRITSARGPRSSTSLSTSSFTVERI